MPGEEDWEHSCTEKQHLQKLCGRMEQLKTGDELGVTGRGVREHNMVFVS